MAMRMPAEWEEQQGTLLCYPQNKEDWPGKFEAVEWDYIEFIKWIARFQKVFLVVGTKPMIKKVSAKLDLAGVDLNQVEFIVQKTDRNWMRDAGPILVKEGGQNKALNFHFNGWAKYDNYELDRAIPEVVAAHLGIEMVKGEYRNRPVVLEGGAIDVNGAGTLLTTKECLLDKQIQVRNRGYNKQDYEKIFRKYLGIDSVIWLDRGVVGDDTHGHVDDLCRFVDDDKIVTVVEHDEKDPNYKALRENHILLQKARLADGTQPEIIELPMPSPVIFEGTRLPASYANFIVINGAVLVPTFNDPNDRLALDIMGQCFPERTIVGIHAVNLIWGLGTLHCLSQQIIS